MNSDDPPTGLVSASSPDRAERELARTLDRRVKELNCLYGISHVIERAGGSLDAILHETANLLRESIGSSAVAGVRILVNGRQFGSRDIPSGEWKQMAPVVVRGEPGGAIEVCHLESWSRGEERLFREQSQNLIDEVAERLGHVVERIDAEELMQQGQAELRERLTHLARVSAVGEMAGSIAHEINQPLTSISLFAQGCCRMIDSGNVDIAELQRALTRISEEAIRAGSVIQHLRSLVRRGSTRRIECDLNNLVMEVNHLTSVDSRLHDVQLRLELTSPLPCIVADAVQLQQVMLNLIRNGIDATESGGSGERAVVVATSLNDSGAVQVSVSDRGCGLPEDAEDVLFESFYTTKEGGMGVGLSISRSIVDAHGGKLWFTRNPGGGTTFSFTIPVSKTDD